MQGLLTAASVTDGDRRANDRHDARVVVIVLAVLAAYAYLFTHAARTLGLPSPQDLADSAGLVIGQVFDSDRGIYSNVRIMMTRRIASEDDELLVFLLALAGAFLSAYFLPLRWKRPSLVAWALVMLLVLYGPRATSGFLCAHFMVYLALHPARGRWAMLGGLVGLSGYLAFVPAGGLTVQALARASLAAIGTFALYRAVVLRLLDQPRAAPVLRGAIVHFAVIVTAAALLVDDAEPERRLPLGLLLFFWQWARLALYHADYQDGNVPAALSLPSYLAVFVSPGAIPSWSWGVDCPLGYSYMNNRFLSRDKNRIVMEGVRILLVALVYLVLWDWFMTRVAGVFESLGVPVHGTHTRWMVGSFMAGERVSAATVLITPLLDLTRFLLVFGAVMHFKVGVWRICGYAIQPYYHHPWQATNLIALWSRFAFYYREFLVRTFYYPVFFRLAKINPTVRAFLASMAAACGGNLLWHTTTAVGYYGPTSSVVVPMLGTWPYFALLGLGIGVTQTYLMKRKRRRKPWTRDRWWITDVLAAYLTLQYFAVIHIFARPSAGSSVTDLARLFLRAFGVSW